MNIKSYFCHRYIYLLVLLSVISCEQNDDDQILKEQIIGTWRSTNYWYRSYTFNQDNTFIDTLFEMHNNTYTVREIISGNYKIENGELIFPSIQMSYVKGQENQYTVGFSDTYNPEFIISFQGDVLALKQKDVFELVSDQHSGIIGKWNHDKLVAVYNKNLQNVFTGGIVKGVYDFKSDLTVDWQYQIIYDNISENISHWKVKYDFIDPQLNIIDWSLYNVSVSFTKNKMIWLYNDLTFKKEK
jgi:hypothetical protein